MKLKSDDWPDSVLHRHFDALAIIVGIAIYCERALPAAKRINELKRRLIDARAKEISRACKGAQAAPAMGMGEGQPGA